MQTLLENACNLPGGGELLSGCIHASGDDERRPSFVDEDGISFVDEAEVVVLRLHRS